MPPRRGLPAIASPSTRPMSPEPIGVFTPVRWTVLTEPRGRADDDDRAAGGLDEVRSAGRQAPSSSRVAVTVITTATKPSRTRGARGERSTEPTRRAPNPSAANHSELATHAPAAKAHR
jgi:hypothetical protein